MISVETLSAPLPGADPCGEDLSQGTSLIELDALILGKPETQFSEAEEPDWREVQERALELINRSRDLRVALALVLASLKIDGLPGLEAGVQLLRELVEKHWENLHPKLDPDDNNDPLQRMNLLSVLAAPLGYAGDPMRFIERLRELPLANSPQLGKFTFGQIDDSRRAAGDSPQKLDPAQVDAALRDTPAEQRQALHLAAGKTLEHLRALHGLLKERGSVSQVPNFGELETALSSVLAILAPYVEGAAPPVEAASSASAGAGGSAAAAPAHVPGTVSTRQDVLRVLVQIREYYDRHEPASPIPLMIRRVERMVPMSFIEIMNEIAPDGMNQVNTIIGRQE